MCGRFAVTTDPARLAAELDAVDEVSTVTGSTDDVEDPAERKEAPRTPGVNYNVAPTSSVMTVVARHSHDHPDDDPALRIRAMRWGLVPAWSKEIGKGPLLFNARAETVTEKSAFRASVKSRRCLVPMDGWYEWRKGGAGADGKPTKTPYFMSPQDGSRVFMAGLWSVWRPRAADNGGDGGSGQNGAPVLSCTIITADAVGDLRGIHDRMPLIMPFETWTEWLDPDHPAPTELLGPPAPDVAAAIDIREVSTLVNKVANNSPDLLAPVEPHPEQGTLL
ncbi:SOS response-associated peptidase [Williamsia sterculiae]|nr:SOS response-associated peptidase [Williamsia sterculiae]